MAETTPTPAAGVSLRGQVAERRTRRPLDVVRLLIVSVTLVLLVGIVVTAEQTTAGLEEDINEAGGLLPSWLLLPLELVAALSAVGLWVGLISIELVRRRATVARDMAVAGTIGAALGLAINAWIDGLAPAAVTAGFMPPAATPVEPGSPVAVYAVSLVALITVNGWEDRVWVQRLSVLSVVAGLSSLILTGETTIQGAAAALLIGRLVGLSVRLALGVRSRQPNTEQLATALAASGLHVERLEKVGSAWPLRYRADLDGEHVSVLVLDRAREGGGLLGAVWRSLRLRRDILPAQALTMRNATDQRALVALAYYAAGVRSRRLVTATSIANDATILVYEDHDIEPLATAQVDAISDEVLTDLWHQVLLMRRADLSHRALSASTVAIDAADAARRSGDGRPRVWITGREGSQVAATGLSKDLDVAQTLVTVGLLVGPERAVMTAVDVLGAPAVAAALPLVQPLALPPETRRALRQQPYSLEALREEVVALTQPRTVAEVSIERLKPRTLFAALGVVVAVSLLAGQLVGVDVLGTITSADPFWLVVSVVCFSVTYVGAAWALLGFVPQPVPLRRTVGTQLSLSFVRLMAPSTVGQSAMNMRLLTKAGVPTPTAATGVAAGQAGAWVVGIPLTVGLALLTGREVDVSFRLSPALVTIGAVLLSAVVVAALFPAVRQRARALWQAFIERGLPRVLDAVQDPRRLLMGLGGNLLLTFSYGLSLYAAVSSVGGEIPLAAAVLVFISGNAVGNIVPTPGGLGAVETALTAGLTASGVPSGIAVSAVLVFRLITFWLPIPFGYATWMQMQRRGIL
jgi:uncharacterized protein (TIRG00374 family)